MIDDRILTYTEIADELDKADLGLAPDCNPVNGLLASYLSGSMTAVLNILDNPVAVHHYVDHCNDDGGLYNPPCDTWHEGYCGIMSIYMKNKA